MRGVLKAIPLGALGFAAAVLVACGGNDRLLPDPDAGNLQAAVAAVQSACANGDSVGAEHAAQRFSDRVAELSPRDVDRRLIENLQTGATTLEDLAARTCTGTSTATTPTTPTTTVPTTPTTTTPTTPTTTVPTTPTTTVPTTPPETTPTTPPNGGGTPGDGTVPPGETPPATGDPGGGGAAPGATQ